ncbi:MAG TPA: hypothetical protein VFG43_14470 [Geminicoccaceae bacterium]|nr:hypothetical protein [Geminicoccaceae bacterium]
MAGYEGLEQPLIRYYDGRAMEANALCPNPRIDGLGRARVVEETPERVVMDVTYHWTDEGQTVDSADGGGKVICSDWGQRTFTFARASGGGLRIAAMSGLQKRL